MYYYTYKLYYTYNYTYKLLCIIYLFCAIINYYVSQCEYMCTKCRAFGNQKRESYPLEVEL